MQGTQVVISVILVDFARWHFSTFLSYIVALPSLFSCLLLFFSPSPLSSFFHRLFSVSFVLHCPVAPAVKKAMAGLPSIKRYSFDNSKDATSAGNPPCTILAGTDDQHSIELENKTHGQDARILTNRMSDATSKPTVAPGSKRSFRKLRWGLITLGFCLGAFLYGKF